MSDQSPVRALFCIGINQNFFDMPAADGGVVWTAFLTMMEEMRAMKGVSVIGDIDDDGAMVGPSTGWPWTCYILADLDWRERADDVCNLFRTVPVGEHRLWRYAKIEARIGRPLTKRADAPDES